MDPSPDLIRPPRLRFPWRVALACVIVVLAGAGATAVAVVEQVHTIVQDISVTKPLTVDPNVLAASNFGQPENLLMVGDDTRSVYKYYTGNVPNLANEMLLVRIDPSKPYISMISLPRELWVKVTEPDGVSYTNRLNSAYTFGTTTLVQTIKQVTGLSVNHVVATTFTQFEAAINQLGCIYDTIDERYYNLNDGVPGTDYQSIDLLPGYQCLNGVDAEQFVSYRHTDTSQVRDARDQSFLLAVKAQYGPLLSSHIGRFEQVFGQTVQTDAGLRSASEILNLADLLVSAAGLQVRQVPFQTSPCSTTCPSGDLTATPEQIEASVQSFLHGANVVPKKQVAVISHKVAGRRGLAALGLTPTLASTLAGEQQVAAKLPFTAEFPKFQDLSGTAVPIASTCADQTEACLRRYRIRAPDGHTYPIYVEAISNGDLGQFYDVQGTTWTGAPLFAHPDQTVTVGPRTYDIFFSGTHVQTVAWRQFGAIYWVHNTLTDAVGNAELLAIAEHTVRVGPVRGLPALPVRTPVTVPVRRAAPVLTTVTPLTTETPLIESIGRVGGLATLVLMPFGLVLTVRNWRRVRGLRESVHSAAAAAELFDSRLLAVTPGYGPLVTSTAGGPLAHQLSAPLTGDAASPVGRLPSRGTMIGLACAATLMLAAAAAVYFTAGTGPTAHPHRLKAQLVPTAKVAVLNPGHNVTAARRLALKLTGEHVKVVAIGLLEVKRPAAYEVLYTSGEAAQARLLAKLLPARHPVVAPINPAARQTLGPKAKLVVLIP